MSKTVGQQLRQAREARSLTPEHVSQATRIRAHYLRAMEEGDFSALPSATQARGFLRAYANYLNLDALALLGALDNGKRKQDNASQSSKDATISTDETPPSAQPSQAPTSAAEQASAFFIEVGQQLRQQRQLLGLSLEDIERHTHLRQHYLIALEAGSLEGLPSPVQGRGMLSNYAAFLGLDPEPLMLHFAEGLQARLAYKQGGPAVVAQESRPAAARSKPVFPAPLRRILSGDLLIGGALALFLIAFVAWGTIRIFAMNSEATPTPTAPSIADVLLASPTATASLTPLPVTPTNPQGGLPPEMLGTNALAGGLLSPSAQDKVQIYITVQERAWMRVLVDGEIEFEGRVIPGSAYPFVGDSSVEILTGNGAALSVFFNQRDLGPMGAFGQVVHRIYTLQGVITPTATITLTPTATLPATATPIPSATPRPGQATVPALP